VLSGTITDGHDRNDLNTQMVMVVLSTDGGVDTRGSYGASDDQSERQHWDSSGSVRPLTS